MVPNIKGENGGLVVLRNARRGPPLKFKTLQAVRLSEAVYVKLYSDSPLPPKPRQHAGPSGFASPHSEAATQVQKRVARSGYTHDGNREARLVPSRFTKHRASPPELQPVWSAADVGFPPNSTFELSKEDCDDASQQRRISESSTATSLERKRRSSWCVAAASSTMATREPEPVLRGPGRIPMGARQPRISLPSVIPAAGPSRREQVSVALEKKKQYSQLLRQNSVLASNHVWYIDKKTHLRRFASMASLNKLYSTFQQVDYDRSASIDAAELERYVSHRFKTSSACGAMALFGCGTDALKGKKLQEAHQKLEYLFQVPGAEMSFKDLLELAYPDADGSAIKHMHEAVTQDKIQSRDEEEAKQAKETMEQSNLLEAKKQARWVDEMWQIWDADGSGELDEEELGVVLQELGANTDDLQKWMQEIDVDESGLISKEEFTEWWVGKAQFQKLGNQNTRYCQSPESRIPEIFQEGNQVEKIEEELMPSMGWTDEQLLVQMQAIKTGFVL
ncbi:hypothetical protein CYMTET_10576 [Cymbomonas tetramitiformis]|uniref:EF-hand domain-containing protein n=1 Tax=Cymbomonas tetramitiformis TaxID=36881 RepID=A0AAE0LEC1_9CHLO|nr:hypothetical protein CYMTET_10576 [Cymbomonas tetramitiformis]